MMSTENLLGEPKEAEQPNPRSLKKSIQVELEKHALENLKFGLGASVISGSILFLLADNQFSPASQWAWLGTLVTSALIIWLWMVNSSRTGGLSMHQTSRLIIIASSLFAVLWGLAAPLFINPQKFETSALTVIVIATLALSWPLSHTHKRIFRHLFLSAIFTPLLGSLYIYYPQIHPGFLALAALLYALTNTAVKNYRQGLIEATGSMLKADLRSQKIITTSQKIASLIEQTPLGFIEWNQQREICLLYTSPSPRDQRGSRMPSSA